MVRFSLLNIQVCTKSLRMNFFILFVDSILTLFTSFFNLKFRALIKSCRYIFNIELEDAIEGIVRNELQAIVTLGGVLGFVVGLLQVGFLFLSQSM